MTALPSDAQLDALREVANIGCGNAATALSQLVGGRTVRIDVPRVHAATSAVQDLADGLGRVLAASLGITGDIEGHMLLLWPEHDAHELAALMLGVSGKGALMEEPRRSALAEAANIVSSACLTAVGTLTRLRLLPSPPALVADDAEAVVQDCLEDGRAADAAVVLETRFYASHTLPLSGHLLIVPDQKSLGSLFRALGL